MGEFKKCKIMHTAFPENFSSEQIFHPI